MRIYVTGGRGFTGRHFIETAQKNGHETYESAADLLDGDAILGELNQFLPDAVVHLAAISFVAHDNPTQIYEVNVVGTDKLFKAIVKSDAQPKKTLVASSANIYGPSQESPINENATPCPNNHYAISKLAEEYLSATYSSEIPMIIARPFNYTGVGQKPIFVVPKIVNHFKEKAGEIELGNLNVRREFNDVRFVTESYIRLLEAEVENTTVNICTGKAYSLQDIFDELQTLTNHQMRISVNPEFVRANEIEELYGDPSLLESLIGPLPEFKLQSTLKTMLEFDDA